MRARAWAGFDVLKAQPMVDPTKLASVGYCFGGTTGSGSSKPGRRFSASSRCTARSALLAGSRQEHQSSRPYPARRRRPVAPMEELNAVISPVPRRQGGLRVNLYSGRRAWVYQAAEPLEVHADDEYKVADEALSQGSLGALNVAFLWVFVARASA